MLRQNRTLQLLCELKMWIEEGVCYERGKVEGRGHVEAFLNWFLADRGVFLR